MRWLARLRPQTDVAAQPTPAVGETARVSRIDDSTRRSLLRCGFALEYTTLGWNVIGIVVLAVAAISARSVALAGFGLDSLIEIGASTVVIWELSNTGQARQRRALRLIGIGFALLAVYLLVQSTWALASSHHPHHSPLGIAWTAITALVMFALAAGKVRTGAALNNRILSRRARPTSAAAAADQHSIRPARRCWCRRIGFGTAGRRRRPLQSQSPTGSTERGRPRSPRRPSDVRRVHTRHPCTSDGPDDETRLGCRSQWSEPNK